MSTNGNPSNTVSTTTARSIYFTKDNLEKIDRIRGTKIKRATVINEIIKNLDDDWIRSVLQ